jgi:hypothetical protein
MLIEGIGPPVWIGYDTSAAVHGFDGFSLSPPFHLVTPRGRNISRLGHVIHRSSDIDRIDCETADGLPIMSPTRTLLQIAATCRRERVEVALSGAIRDRLTTEDFLHRRLTALRAPGRNGVSVMLEVLEHHELLRGGDSWLERELLRLIAGAGLPAPRTQAVLGRRGDRLIRVDGWFDGTPVVIEALGYRWHRSTAQMAIDAERANRLVLDGYLPLQWTYQQIVTAPETVVAALTEALGRYGIGPGRPGSRR